MRRRMRSLGAIALLGGLLCACQEERVITLSGQLSLRYLAGCAPERVEQVAVEPLGDFALGEQSSRSLSFSDMPAVLSSLPVDTRWYRLGVTTASYRGVALSRAGGEGASADALLLPLGQSCSVFGALPIPSDGAAALIGGQDLLLAGGADESGDGSQRASVLYVAQPRLLADDQGLLVPRARAAALGLAGETWLLGGATSLRPGSAALDSFDRYDAAQASFGSLGRLRVRRVDASAARLLDGRVLLVGGRASVAGPALASIELLASDGASSELWSEPLPFPAASATLAVRDDGRVLLAAEGERQTRLALIDPGSRAAVELEPPALAGTRLAPQLVVALPGARVALFEVDVQGETSGRLQLLLADGSYLALSDWLSSFAGISAAQAISLGDGRILLTGLRQGQPLMRVIDPGNRDVSVRGLDLAVTHLFMRDDGSVLLVGPEGARVLREDARTPYDNPGGTLLADDSAVLCLDAYGRFERAGLTLRSRVPGARFDLAGLRYRDVELSLQVAGEAELLLRRADGQERSIAVGGSQVGPAFCTIQVPSGAPLTLLRNEQRVSLQVGDQSKSCVLDGFQGSISIALRALDEGVVVSDLRAQRK